MNRDPTTLVHRELVPSLYAVLEEDKVGAEDARRQGALEEARLCAEMRKTQSANAEARVTAELRGVAALQREHTRHHYEAMLHDLGALQRGDRLRKGRTLNNVSRLVAGAPAAIAWSDAAQAERLCERKFEQNCLLQRPTPAPEMTLKPSKVGVADRQTSNTSNNDAVLSAQNKSSPKLDIRRDLPHDSALSNLLNRIKSQRDAWAKDEISKDSCKVSSSINTATPMAVVERSPSPYNPERLHSQLEDLSEARNIRAKVHKQIRLIDQQLRNEAQARQHVESLEAVARAQRRADEVLENVDVQQQRHVLEAELHHLEDKMAMLHSHSAALSPADDSWQYRQANPRHSPPQRENDTGEASCRRQVAPWSDDSTSKNTLSLQGIRQYQQLLLERAATISRSSSAASAELLSEVVEKNVDRAQPFSSTTVPAVSVASAATVRVSEESLVPHEVVAAKLRLQEHQMKLESQKEALLKNFLQFRLKRTVAPAAEDSSAGVTKPSHSVPGPVMRQSGQMVETNRAFESCALHNAAMVSDELKVEALNQRRLVEEHFISASTGSQCRLDSLHTELDKDMPSEVPAGKNLSHQQAVLEKYGDNS